MQVTPERERLQTLANSADYYFGMGDLLREWNELDEAERHLTQGMDLARGTLTVYVEIVTLGYTALARLQEARGNFQGALETLSAFAELADQRHFVPRLLARGAAVQAQIAVAHGHLEAAVRWVEENGLSASDEEMRYPREREYLSLARVRIAQGQADPAGAFLHDALHVLARLLQDAQRKARRGSAIEILLLQALAWQAQAQPDLLWLPLSGRSRWPNQRATCASSSMRVPRCWPCYAWPMRGARRRPISRCCSWPLVNRPPLLLLIPILVLRSWWNRSRIENWKCCACWQWDPPMRRLLSNW